MDLTQIDSEIRPTALSWEWLVTYGDYLAWRKYACNRGHYWCYDEESVWNCCDCKYKEPIIKIAKRFEEVLGRPVDWLNLTG